MVVVPYCSFHVSVLRKVRRPAAVTRRICLPPEPPSPHFQQKLSLSSERRSIKRPVGILSSSETPQATIEMAVVLTPLLQFTRRLLLKQPCRLFLQWERPGKPCLFEVLENELILTLTISAATPVDGYLIAKVKRSCE